MLPIAMNNRNLQTFVGKVMSENITGSALPLGHPEPIDGTCIEVEKILYPIYPVLQCHHNCRIHQLNNKGDVIYGWSLLTGVIEGDTYCVAQHHAIWRKGGCYWDVTPELNPAIKKITFLPDNRVQVGHGITISVPPLFIWADNGVLWSDGIQSGSRMAPCYFETIKKSSDSAIAALKLTPP